MAQNIGSLALYMKMDLEACSDNPEAGLKAAEAHPITHLSARIARAYKDLERLEQTPDYLGEELWPFIRSLTLPFTDRVFFERNFDQLRRVSAALSSAVNRHLVEGLKNGTIVPEETPPQGDDSPA